MITPIPPHEWCQCIGSKSHDTNHPPPNGHGHVSEENLPPPPDGGFHAWAQVLCAHFTFFNSWGVSNSFSVFEQVYTHTLPQSASAISWIGSVQVSLLFFMGAFVGRATDSGYFRPVYSLGVFLQLVGIFMLSLCETYWQVFLAQAVCMGLGNGFTFSPGLAVMSSYFVKRRAFAVGLAAAGAATGGVGLPRAHRSIAVQPTDWLWVDNPRSGTSYARHPDCSVSSLPASSPAAQDRPYS